MAQQRALLISEKYVKLNSEIDANVSVELIRPTIWYCQKEFIEKSLGTVFYNALIAECIANSGQLVTTSYITLVNEYLSDALLFWVRSEIIIPLTYKMRNKSIGKNTDPNQQVIDVNEVDKLRDFYRMKAEYFTKRMETFLCANETIYPLWLDCSIDGVDARETKPQTSLFLD